LIFGCQPPHEERDFFETQAKVEEAKAEADTARILDAEGLYAGELQRAETEARNAEAKLNLHKLNEAYGSAMLSLQSSRRIFKQFYLERIARLAEQSKLAIQEEVRKDADSPLQDLLPELDRILDVADQLQSGRMEMIPENLQADLVTTTQTQQIIEGITKAKLESDFSFDPGKYTLSVNGQLYLEQIVQHLIRQVEELSLDFPDKNITIRIKVVGYTDEQPFKEGTRLIRNLMDGIAHLAPERGKARRQFLNQRLSQFRAQSISDDFKRLFADSQILSGRVRLDEEVIGKGEEIPQGVLEPYPQNDPRRRICKIYSYVIAE
jgi:outer membrane protein OmpA-like peptidoglycan-associated protein